MEKLMKKAVIGVIVILAFYFIYRQIRFYYNTPIFIPFSARLNAHDLVLVVGESYHLRPQGINKRVSYSSTDFKIADVRFTGKVTAYRVGKAVINADVSGTKVQCMVTVIDINKSKVTIGVGKHETLEIEGINKTPDWKSNNKNVVTIDNDGEITGIGEGTTTISGEVAGKTLKCKVTVKKSY